MLSAEIESQLSYHLKYSLRTLLTPILFYYQENARKDNVRIVNVGSMTLLGESNIIKVC